ncbi:MAG: PocR ligand-binding domain-containing protein [Endomicrobiia bacterium]
MRTIKENLKLKGIANVKILEKFQNLFLKLTGLYTTFIDTDGNFVTSDRGLRPFCLLIGKLGLGGKCWECNYVACKKVIKLKKPIIYNCFAGLTEIISPIIVNGKVLGAVLTGQIRVKERNFKLNTNILKCIKETDLQKLQKAFIAVPVITKQQAESAAQLLYELINYIFKIEFEILVYRETEKYGTPSQEIAKKVMNLINSNYPQDISLRTIADEIHISPFYLSHIFRKETGFSIPGYINKVRLENSIKLLKNPTIPIKQIPAQVGYRNEYYFFKVFKKVFQTTPSNFRKQYFSK